MGFGETYLRYFNVLRDLGLLSPTPITTAGGVTVSPLQVVKAVLPEPTSLAPGYTGKTCIGTLVEGTRAGARRRTFFYNICDHKASYEEVESQAISYTTGVPAVTAVLLYLKGAWSRPGLWNIEQLDPDPFLSLMPHVGLTWDVLEVSDECAPKPPSS
jgi:carboxynorspermidine synthase